MKPGTLELLQPVARDARPLVLHIVHRFDVGGLENGLVNLINHMPADAYRHLVLALTGVSDFRLRVRRADVGFAALHKGPGHGLGLYAPLLRLLRALRPAVVHTRNLGPLEMQPVAALAGVPARLHGEHGRDLNDLDGSNRRLQWVRRAYAPFVQRWVALSQDLQRYLVERVGVRPARVAQVYNGVDCARFRPATARRVAVAGCPFAPGQHWLVGTVGRMQGVKHQTLLAEAFVQALVQQPGLRAQARLVLVGDGPLRARCAAILQQAGMADLAWLPGERADVAEVMQMLDCFVLPSLAEGISNTILEAMASGLPVLACNVGGNGELLAHGRTGLLLPSADVQAMASALLGLAGDRAAAAALGRNARAEAERSFSLQAMVAAYQAIYDTQLGFSGKRH